MNKIDFRRLIFSTDKATVKGPHLQWHLTDKCNLRCNHCYQDSYIESGLPMQQQLEILEQFKGLILFFRERMARKVKGHITLTGGEPFVRGDFLQLLETISSQSDWFTFSILTNGTLVDDLWSKALAKMKVKYVQVSLDGDKVKHDEIRGIGSFDKTIAAIKSLRKQDIRVLVSFTATRSNYLLFSAVAEICRNINANFLWSDRLIPEGSGKKDINNLMTAKETNHFFKMMKMESEKCKKNESSVTRVKMHRALQFQYSQESPYRCVAGDTLVTIMPNGDLYPCRRMPVKVGNVLETSLAALYYQSPLMRSLRDASKVSEGCESCNHQSKCRGGLKCLSYAIYQKAYVKDPGCEIGSVVS